MNNKKKSKDKEAFIPIEKLVPKVKKFSAKQKIIFIACLIFIAVCLFTEYSPNSKSWSDISKEIGVNENIIEENGKFYAHFIDVGQADCELLKCGDDIVLIDAGDVDGFEAISSYLDSQNVEKIDYFIITHMHSDHIGSAAEVIEKYKPDNIIMTKLTQKNVPTTDLYKNLLTVISNSGAKVIAAKPGNTYELNNFGFAVLAPNDDYGELNNTSVVVKAYFGNTAFIFEGDAENKSEKDILKNNFNVKADVLKLGHHGSKTSNSAEYLDAVSPEYAIVCCGENNKYNHPGEETLEKLAQRNISCYRTDKNGNIVAISDGNKVIISTER